MVAIAENAGGELMQDSVSQTLAIEMLDATSTTLPVRVYSQLKTAVTPEINALCTLTMGVTFCIVIVSQILGSNKFKRNRREEL